MTSVWITPEKTLDRSASYRFEKTVNATKNAEIELNISADTRYRFTVNGKYVCEGPCQSDHYTWKYETVRIPKNFLRDGENKLVFTVLYIVGDVFYMQAKKFKPGLLVFGKLKDGEREEDILTGTDFRCFIENRKYYVKDPVNYVSLPPVERFTLERDTEVKTVVYCGNNIDGQGYTPFGLADKYPLEKRMIKLLKPEKPVKFTVTRSGKDFIELDAGIYTTAYPEFVFKGKRGEKIRFIYAESYCAEGNRNKKGRRDKAEGVIVGFCDEITMTGAKQKYSPFCFRAFRYVKAEFPEGTEFDASAQSYQPYFYPIEEKGYVKTDSEYLNKVWDISLNTVRCCTHESFVDCPHYEQCQYDMDSALEMMFMFRVTDDYSMGRKAVYDLARSQRPDGMLCAHYPASFVQVIPCFSLYWILMLKDYVVYSGDIRAAKELLPTADKILTAFGLLRGENGLVGNTKYWHYTDWVPGWSRGVPPYGDKNPLTLSSMMYSTALGEAAYLCGLVGREGLQEEYLATKKSVNEAVNKNCYDEKEGFYVDVPGFGGFSEHTAVWAVLSGAVEGEEAGKLIDRSFAGNYNRASFSFNYYTFRAIEKTGRYGKYADKLFEGWKKMYDLGCTTWCENPDNPRSECHGWSSAPIYEYSAVKVGVQPLSPAFEEVSVKPDFAFAGKVEASVPTPKGMIKTGWEKTGDRISYYLSVPKGVTASLRLPDGRNYTVRSGKKFTAEV